ncbi:MAG: TonB-dependent receptor [Paludibacter sp.]|nr:TonB-dependent receptor [Paludibacter sp.]
MKKKSIAGRMPLNYSPWLKRLLIMKMIAILILVVGLTSSYAESDAQTAKINLKFTNGTVKDVLEEIEHQTNLSFMYDNDVFKVNRKISIEAENETLKSIVEKLISGENLKYEMVNRYIVITSTKETTANQQGKKVTGKVTDSSGATLPGVSVVVKGTTTGVITDNNGNFSLSNISENATVQFSFVGMKTQEILVSGKTIIDITLAEDAIGIEEVVAVGYGTQKKVNLTGAVASVSGNIMTKRPVANPSTMLQGLLPGVSVVQASGQPGQGNISIQIRGKGTYSGAGSNPLILIDGVPGNLESLDANTIESVSVLKDAASSSIYGSRGANGVILVTTKNGKNGDGKIKVEYNFNYGINSPTKMLDMVTNSADYMRAWNTRIRNNNYGVDIPARQYPQAEIDKYENATDRIQYPNFDWVDYLVNPAPTTMHNLSVSGGKQTYYNLSLGYTDQEGTMKAFNYKKYNAQLNVVSEVSKKLKIGTNIQFKNGKTIADAGGQSNYFLCILAQPPTIMPTVANGSGLYSWRAYPFEECNWNPYEQMKENGTITDDYSRASQIWSDFEVIKGLHWNFKAAANYSTSQFTQFAGNTDYERLYRDPSVLGYQYVTLLSKNNSQDIYTNVYTYLNYDKKIGSHNFNLMAGYSNEEDNNNYIKGWRNGYVSPSTPELNAGSANGQTNNGSSTAWAIESVFGRLNYNFKEKYFLETNVRYDGTSRLSSATRWGAFPSVSAGWRLSEESFMASTKSWLSNAKLRASWGMLGNQNIGTYPYQAMLNLTGVYPFDNANLSSGAAQTSLNNENITWETTTSSDIGLDLTLFDKLSFSFDIYKKFTSDILRPAQVTGVVGLSAPTVNSGAMQNTGFDLEMQYRDRIKSGTFKDLNFGGGLNLSAYNNKLVTFGKKQDNTSTIYEEGRPWNTFYLLQVEGIFQTKEEIANSPKQYGENTQPGMLKFKDTSGDGKIDNNDRVPMEKGVFPAFTYGFNFSADWKGFDLYGIFQGVAGSKVYVTGWGIQPFTQGSAPTKKQLAEAWTPENKSNTEVMLGDPKSFSHPSTYLLKDNSYLRLKTLQIGYTLPDQWISKLRMSKLRVYFAGDNLLTFTKYEGLDPERADNGRFVNYPQNKVISFGCNVNF